MATKVISHEKESFLTDIKEIRRRARQQIMEGAVTSDYRGDRETVVRVLIPSARDRNSVRPPLQAPPLHGKRHPLSSGCAGVY
jgi:hypothetical protein